MSIALPNSQDRCGFCKVYASPQPTDLEAHWNNRRRPICPVPGCGLSFPCLGLLAAHQRTVHRHPASDAHVHKVCNSCNIYFMTESTYKMHLYHKPAKQCMTCGFTSACTTAIYLHEARMHFPRRA